MSDEIAIPESLRPGALLRRFAYLALWAYIFSVPLEYTIVLPEPMESFARVIGVIAFVSGFASVVITGNLRRWKTLHWLVILYVALASLSLLWDRAPNEDAYHALREYLQGAPVILLAWEFAQENEQRTQLLVGYLLGSLITAGMTIRNGLVLHQARYAWFRYSVGNWNPNELAIVLAVGVPLALYLTLGRCLHVSRLQAAVAWSYLVLGPAAMLFTGSRTGMVCVAFAFVATPFLFVRSTRSKRYAFMLTFAGLICVALLLVPAGDWAIFSTVDIQVKSGDLDERVKIWRFGWEAFLRSPFFGYGVGSFRWASGTLYNAHNTYLEVSVEQGTAGLLLILGLMVGLLVRLRRAATTERVTGFFCFMTWAIGATVAHLEELRVTWVVFALAFLFGCDRSSREGEPHLEPSHSGETIAIPGPSLQDVTGELNGGIDERPAEG